MAAVSVAALELAGTLSLLAIAPPSKPAQLEVTPLVTAIQLVRLQQTPYRHLSLLAVKVCATGHDDAERDSVKMPQRRTVSFKVNLTQVQN